MKIFILVLLSAAYGTIAFLSPSVVNQLRVSCKCISSRSSIKFQKKYSRLFQINNADKEDDLYSKDVTETKVGSKEYYKGFLTTPVNESRGDGIEQAVKLGVGAAGFLLVLTFAFLKSNNII